MWIVVGFGRGFLAHELMAFTHSAKSRKRRRNRERLPTATTSHRANETRKTSTTTTNGKRNDFRNVWWWLTINGLALRQVLSKLINDDYVAFTLELDNFFVLSFFCFLCVFLCFFAVSVFLFAWLLSHTIFCPLPLHLVVYFVGA